MKKKAALIICGLAVLTAVYILEVKPRLEAYEYVRNMPIGSVDLAGLADGTRDGEFAISDIRCRVRVAVKNKKIESIEIVENATNDLAKKAEKVRERVMAAQSLQVECVTGATATSKAILKSIENALRR